MNDKTPQEQLEERKKGRKAFADLLRSPTGERLIEELEAEFDPDDIVGATPQETYYNLGERHVVRFLKALAKE